VKAIFSDAGGQGWPDRGGVGGVTPPNRRKFSFFLVKSKNFLVFF
jgi:hypothetical protein